GRHSRARRFQIRFDCDVRLDAIALHSHAAAAQMLALEDSDDAFRRCRLGGNVGLEAEIAQRSRRLRAARELPYARERGYEILAQLGRMLFDAREDAPQTFAGQQNEIVDL